MRIHFFSESQEKVKPVCNYGLKWQGKIYRVRATLPEILNIIHCLAMLERTEAGK